MFMYSTIRKFHFVRMILMELKKVLLSVFRRFHLTQAPLGKMSSDYR